MTNDERLRILYGDPKHAPPEKWTLRAGPLTLVYEATGDVRYIRWGGREILRCVYGAVRDEAWGTVPAEVTEVERVVGEDHFRIVYEARHRDAARGIDFRWRGTVTGETDGTVTFDFDGEALSTFRRNRIGLCVLHPADLKGQSCVVRHGDGAEEAGAFPDLIAPHQPFFDVAAITHEVAPGVSATVTFSGDVFEMEDQRNWLDASYKTYSTPLALTFPVEVPAGTRIRQTVTLRLAGAAATTLPAVGTGPVVVTVGVRAGAPVPSLGLYLPADWGQDEEAGDAVPVSSYGFQPGHFHVELDPARADGGELLPVSAALARKFAASLVVGVRHSEALPDLLPDGLPQARRVDDWLLLPPTGDVVAAVRRAFGDGEGVGVGGGSSTNFTELNRRRPEVSLDALCFAANPQVHAFDSLSIMETPPMVAETLRSARHLGVAGTPNLYLGPLTLYGPYAAEDARQSALLGAAWYTAAVAYAISAGASAVTLCEPAGPRGIVAEDGTPYPLYFALGQIQEVLRDNAEIRLATVSDPLRIAALAAGDTLLLVNLTDEPQGVAVRGLPSEELAVSTLDETNASEGFSEPKPVPSLGGESFLTMNAYAVAHLSWEGADA